MSGKGSCMKSLIDKLPVRPQVAYQASAGKLECVKFVNGAMVRKTFPCYDPKALEEFAKDADGGVVRGTVVSGK